MVKVFTLDELMIPVNTEGDFIIDFNLIFLRPRQFFFSYVRTGLPGLNQY